MIDIGGGVGDRIGIDFDFGDFWETFKIFNQKLMLINFLINIINNYQLMKQVNPVITVYFKINL